MARKDRKSKGISVDLSNVEDSKVVLPEGQYQVAVSEATLEKSDKSGNQYIKFEFVVSEGSNKGQKLYHNCSLQPQALFNLKAVLGALGFTIPKKAFDLDLKDLVDLECMVEVSHELYEGKKKSRITEFVSAEDSEEEDSEEEDMDYDEMSIEELKEEADEQEIEYKKAIKGKKDKEAKKILIELLEENEEEEEDSEEEDSEEEDMDYDEMSIEELKEECKKRGLKTGKKPKKNALIELLEEDDED